MHLYAKQLKRVSIMFIGMNVRQLKFVKHYLLCVVCLGRCSVSTIHISAQVHVTFVTRKHTF